jgi:tRNA pseudouridine65 synthase
MLAFRVYHEDDAILVVDKPAGFHSHPPEDKAVRISPRWNGLAILERQIGRKLYPAHRLDRASSGLLVLSKSREWNRTLQSQFASREVEKVYCCVVRGRLDGDARLDRPLSNSLGEQEALTLAEALADFTLALDGTARTFTFVRAMPVTGRFHQIRRHLAQVGLPLLGDQQHGDKKLNRSFARGAGRKHLFLRCLQLRFAHPVDGRTVSISARWGRDWHALFDRAGVCPLLGFSG